MKAAEGIDIRPLKEITGDSLFNEVYFDDVLLPDDAVVGEVNEGWQVARNTVGNERVHMADQVAFDTGLEALIEGSDGLDDTYQHTSRHPDSSSLEPARSEAMRSKSNRLAERRRLRKLADGKSTTTL